MWIYIALGVLAWLAISFIIAVEFEEIAAMKGHRSRRYFWLPFLFGVAGYLMVVALPTRPVDEED